ncbi:SDR family oxidoreductase [Luteibacter aegosomaticola]|uniref:SDR family oxidoreductase n=1 Tax=Luteibacter aegosomaticola TaxID=2911538 RepID=UPI001FF9133C|nr:SDR family oxidoreductase [Luteibacter aegosomaticola]UPG90260.1 SDR family oxidoreductase [Luteibacter aegosomaticola]
MQTVLITGCSSGFGLETARHFLAQGWRVVATMRTPNAELFPASEHLKVVALDVTDPASIQRALAEAGPIDVLVNNAGIGMFNALEGTPIEVARDVFETNTLGTFAMTQAVLPQFREKKAGTIINVTSTVTLRPLPLLSVYTASKAAVNAFSESVAHELAPFGIRVRVVLPGRAPTTRFGENARARIGDFPAPYADFAGKVFEGLRDATTPTTSSSAVAEAVWRAATDPNCPARIPAGEDAEIWFNA